MAAVREALGDVTFHLEDYHVDAITGGTDAVVTVHVTVTRGDRSVSVDASDSDITNASVTAVVDALDRLLPEKATEAVAD